MPDAAYAVHRVAKIRALKLRTVSADPGDVTRSLTIFGMVVGSTLGGIAPMMVGGGLISSLAGSVIGGVLGIWAGVRANEWFA